MNHADSAEKPPVFEDERGCMKTVGNFYALIRSVRDLNDQGIHPRWSFSLAPFDQRGFFSGINLIDRPLSDPFPTPFGWLGLGDWGGAVVGIIGMRCAYSGEKIH